jgi:Transposase DDE domain
VLCNVTHIARLRSSLLDKSKDFAQELPPALLNNLLVVGCTILLKETVNLNKLKNQVGLLLGNRLTKTDSHYKRLRRFFNDKTAQHKLWKWLIVWLLAYIKSWEGRSRSVYLTLDGTNWQLGSHHIHLLMLCIVYRGVSLPLLWCDLGKKRHSSQQERKRLLQQAMKRYPLSGLCLLADREYEGKEWFKFLTESKINFIIRLPRESYKADISTGGKAYSALLKRALKGRTVSQWFELEGYRYQFVALCHQDGPQSADPLVLLVSNLSWSKQTIAERYRIRWTTECFFKHLKSNGFDLEALGFQSPKKIRLVVAIVVVLYVICVAEGLRQFDRIQSKRKDPHAPLRLRESVFRKGYSVVVNELVGITQFVDWLLAQFTKPLKVPIRLVFFNVQH